MKKILCSIMVLSILLSCDDIIEVEDISNRTVNALAPADQAILTTTSVTFTWEDVEDAEQYKLQVATPNFENAAQIVIDELIVIDSTMTSTNFTGTLEIGNYQWRVRAENSAFETGYTTQSFTIEQ